MLTPVDIQNKTFEVKFRGYSTEEVDNFMDMLTKDYETLYQENIALKDKITLLTNAVEQYKQMEETLQNSIVLAQATGENIKKSADENAKNILKAAEVKGEEIIRDANGQLAELKGQISGMKTEVESYKSRIKGICNGLLEMLDKME